MSKPLASECTLRLKINDVLFCSRGLVGQYVISKYSYDFIGEYIQGKPREKGICGYYLTRYDGGCSETVYVSARKHYSEEFHERWAFSYEEAVRKSYARQKAKLATFEKVYSKYLMPIGEKI